jgi:hypothetical protein
VPPAIHPNVSLPLIGPAAREGRRTTIDPVVVGRAASESADFDMNSISRSMKMNVLVMGPNRELRHWKNRVFYILSLKVAYMIPHKALRDSGVYLDERAHSYTFALLLHVASDNRRTNQAVRCVIAARPDCGAAAWEILYEGMDARSFARSLAWLDNLILRQRHARARRGSLAGVNQPKS